MTTATETLAQQFEVGGSPAIRLRNMVGNAGSMLSDGRIIR